MSKKNLNLPALTALVVGSMIGAGIFSLPQNIAAQASVGATLIGWGLTAIGMLMLAFVFQMLANRKPELNNGIYAYAKEGFGNYVGFSSAWGYWLSAVLGNVSYYVLIFATLGYFLPAFGKGNTIVAIVCASTLLWALQVMIARGIKNATTINQIITVAKIVPLLTFVAIVCAAFDTDIFVADFWGQNDIEFGSVMSQVKNMMMVTVWVFIGIEGASIYSGRAARRSDIGKATILGFLMVLCLLVSVNVLAMGVMSRPELAALDNPSMAYILEYLVGPWGAVFISVGLIVSVLGALLSHTLYCAEILFSTASDKAMPRFLATENTNNVPNNALLLSTLVTQIFLVITYFSEHTYTSLFYLATSTILLPYCFSATYALKLMITGDCGEGGGIRPKEWFLSVIAVLYSLWLIYAAGVKYILLSALLYLLGTILYAIARREYQQKIFSSYERYIFLVVCLASGASVYGLYTGAF